MHLEFLIEELEAWFFGDIAAIHAAYPRISIHLGGRANYRDPDAITGEPGKPWKGSSREANIF